jgi:hypothetical protein
MHPSCAALVAKLDAASAQLRAGQTEIMRGLQAPSWAPHVRAMRSLNTRTSTPAGLGDWLQHNSR